MEWLRRVEMCPFCEEPEAGRYSVYSTKYEGAKHKMECRACRCHTRLYDTKEEAEAEWEDYWEYRRILIDVAISRGTDREGLGMMMTAYYMLKKAGE